MSDGTKTLPPPTPERKKAPVVPPRSVRADVPMSSGDGGGRGAEATGTSAANSPGSKARPSLSSASTSPLSTMTHSRSKSSVSTLSAEDTSASRQGSTRRHPTNDPTVSPASQDLMTESLKPTFGDMDALAHASHQAYALVVAAAVFGFIAGSLGIQRLYLTLSVAVLIGFMRWVVFGKVFAREAWLMDNLFCPPRKAVRGNKTGQQEAKETAVWLNEVVSRYWRSFEPDTSKQTQELLDWYLAEGKPDLFTSIATATFALGKDAAPRLDNVAFFDTHSSEQSVLISADLVFDSDARWEIDLKSGKQLLFQTIRVKVDRVKIAGRVLIKFRFRASYPYLTHVTFAFWQQPKVTMNIQCLGLALTHVPVISKWIREAVESSLKYYMVYPASYTYSMLEEPVPDSAEAHLLDVHAEAAGVLCVYPVQTDATHEKLTCTVRVESLAGSLSHRSVVVHDLEFQVVHLEIRKGGEQELLTTMPLPIGIFEAQGTQDEDSARDIKSHEERVETPIGPVIVPLRLHVLPSSRQLRAAYEAKAPHNTAGIEGPGVLSFRIHGLQKVFEDAPSWFSIYSEHQLFCDASVGLRRLMLVRIGRENDRSAICLGHASVEVLLPDLCDATVIRFRVVARHAVTGAETQLAWKSLPVKTLVTPFALNKGAVAELDEVKLLASATSSGVEEDEPAGSELGGHASAVVDDDYLEHDGEQLYEMVHASGADVVSDRMTSTGLHGKCFRGKDLLDYVVNQTASDGESQAKALARRQTLSLCQLLFERHLVVAVEAGVREFSDSKELFRFAADSGTKTAAVRKRDRKVKRIRTGGTCGWSLHCSFVFKRTLSLPKDDVPPHAYPALQSDAEQAQAAFAAVIQRHGGTTQGAADGDDQAEGRGLGHLLAFQTQFSSLTALGLPTRRNASYVLRIAVDGFAKQYVQTVTTRTPSDGGALGWSLLSGHSQSLVVSHHDKLHFSLVEKRLLKDRNVASGELAVQQLHPGQEVQFVVPLVLEQAGGEGEGPEAAQLHGVLIAK
eukprot:m.304454 g.304454  ORF g.304454 m.304454 type:complete len:1019 (-) comp19603_c0_seq4:37-3093(-)